MNRPDVLNLVVARRIDETADILSVELVRPDGRPLPSFKAGAHVDVHIGAGTVRQYSICNSPSRQDRYRLAILRAAESRGGSLKLHAVLQTGASVQIGHPRNGFQLDEDAEHVLLIGGGIGITPLLSMAYRLHEIGVPFALHYCVKSWRQAAFLDELARCEFRKSVHLHFDDGEPTQRLNIEQLARQRTAQLYLCGPGGFMDWVQRSIIDAGFPERHVHLERFAAAPITNGNGFTVIATRSGVQVEVSREQSIADALTAVGVCVPLSCEQGVCGTCLTRVVNGIPEHRDQYQTEEEKAANTHIALCCSRAISSSLALDI